MGGYSKTPFLRNEIIFVQIHSPTRLSSIEKFYDLVDKKIKKRIYDDNNQRNETLIDIPSHYSEYEIDDFIYILKIWKIISSGKKIQLYPPSIFVLD